MADGYHATDYWNSQRMAMASDSKRSASSGMSLDSSITERGRYFRHTRIDFFRTIMKGLYSYMLYCQDCTLVI